MSQYVFITDSHFNSHSNVRNGDVLDDLIQKFDWVIDYCNTHDCILLHGGDVFDKPSVPDFVKARVLKSLTKLETKALFISGNHDLLWNNPEFKYRTSYNVLGAANRCQDIDNKSVEFDDVIITNQVPVETRNKPQIVLFHGFLNQEDGRCTFRFTDINTDDNVCILLGHDHVQYDVLKYTDKIKIIRPGSFLRGIRNDEAIRTPQIVHLVVRDGKILHKMVDIDAARDANGIFKTKKVTITKAQQSATYDKIIESIRNSDNTNLTFKQAMQQVSTPDVVDFAMNVLEEAKLTQSNKL